MSDILVVDNYDSFTFNLVHLLDAISGGEVRVFRVDEVPEEEFRRAEFIVFSPGPGLPGESPQLIELTLSAMKAGKKALGVCLGHQALATATGGGLRNLSAVHHGVSHDIRYSDGAPLFRDIPNPLKIGRYHSWVVDEKTLSPEWVVDSRDEFGEVMSMHHRTLPVFGVQFHPESVLSPNGRKVLENFLTI